MVLGAAGVHELGHWLVLQGLGAPVTGFRLSTLGAVLETDSGRLSYGEELSAVLAGPAANLLAALALTAPGRDEFLAAAGANGVLQPSSHPSLGWRKGTIPAGLLAGGSSGRGDGSFLGRKCGGGRFGSRAGVCNVADGREPVAAACAACQCSVEFFSMAFQIWQPWHGRVSIKHSPCGANTPQGPSVNRQGCVPSAPEGNYQGPSGRRQHLLGGLPGQLGLGQFF